MRFEFQTSFREHYVASLTVLSRLPLQIVLSTIFPLAALLLLFLSLASETLDPLIIIVIALGFGFTPLITALKVWLHRRRNKTVVGRLVYEINEEGIRVSGGVFELKLAWDAVRKVVETKRFFLFFLSSQMAQFLPKRAITDAEELSSVRRLVAAKRT